MSKSFTTSRGIVLECLPIPTLLEKLQAQHPLPEPPTYEVKTATGIVEKHVHDETTLETDAEKAAWADYQLRRAAAERELQAALMRIILVRGIKVDLPESDGWIKEQEYIGLSVPSDPFQRRLYYLETEALVSQSDYEGLVLAVMAASGISEEALAQVEATFRHPVERDEAGGPELAGDGAELAHERPVRAGKNSHQKRHPAPERL